ncbi:NAD(P)/FAD-dependent oxidoreductase [Thermoproteota archaeon]
MERVDVTIIGAGVVSLAVAARLSKQYDNVFIVEKEGAFGQGASSRNSEVIHAGIYYPTDSLKAKTCVEGRQMLYEICDTNKIPCKKIQKLVVATCDKEVKQVEDLFKRGIANGVLGLEIIDSSKVKALEPNIKAKCALFSKESGIIDSHKLMEHLCAKAKENGVGIVYQSEVKGIQKTKGVYEIAVQDSQKDTFTFTSRVVVNAAGLNSDSIAALAGMDVEKLGYNLKYCKGEYFRLASNKSKMIQRLVYPVPEQSDGGLGIHLTPDISGQVRLGPDAEYLFDRREDYDVNVKKQRYFYDSVKEFAPFVEEQDISPDMSGIRPKLQGPKEEFRDFIIKEESDNGFPGFVNLIGIESPGLTAAVSIARYVEKLLKIGGN